MCIISRLTTTPPAQDRARLRQLHLPPAQARHVPAGAEHLLAEEERDRREAAPGRAAQGH